MPSESSKRVRDRSRKDNAYGGRPDLKSSAVNLGLNLQNILDKIIISNVEQHRRQVRSECGSLWKALEEQRAKYDSDELLIGELHEKRKNAKEEDKKTKIQKDINAAYSRQNSCRVKCEDLSRRFEGEMSNIKEIVEKHTGIKSLQDRLYSDEEIATLLKSS